MIRLEGVISDKMIVLNGDAKDDQQGLQPSFSFYDSRLTFPLSDDWS